MNTQPKHTNTIEYGEGVSCISYCNESIPSLHKARINKAVDTFYHLLQPDQVYTFPEFANLIEGYTPNYQDICAILRMYPLEMAQ